MPLRPLSINFYTLGFLLLIALLFSMAVWQGFRSIETTTHNLERHRHKNARIELEQALDHLSDRLDDLPEQWPYWPAVMTQAKQLITSEDTRKATLQALDLPDFLDQIALYDANGKRLTQPGYTTLPLRIRQLEHAPEVRIDPPQAWMEHYFPIRQPHDPKVYGWLGLGIDLISGVKKLYEFRDLDKTSLHLPDDASGQVTPKDLALLLEYQLKSDPETTQLINAVRHSIMQFAIAFAGIALLYYLLMVRILGRPLQGISQYIDQLHLADRDMPDAPKTILPIAELEKVRNSLVAYDKNLRKAQKDLDRKNRALWKLAHHDALTGILNRRAFDRDWENARQVLHRRRIEIGLALFDVNRFKAINDSYGHQIGDEVLKAITHSIQSTLRRGEQLYRIGGDEFASILIGAPPEDMLKLARRSLKSIEEIDFKNLGLRESVRVSCGIAYCPANDIQRLNKLQWQADVAVYQAKKPGNREPVLFEDSMADGSQSIFSSWINEAVYKAVTSGEGVVLHYQSIVNTRTLDIDYYESLLRIRHENGYIPPSHIFPVIRSRQLETALDRSVIHRLAQDLGSDKLKGVNGVSINLSAESLVRNDLVDWLEPLRPFLTEYQITLEVTETSLITHLATASEHLTTLRHHGFKVALDDFGSGYSSLRYLTDMPVDTIKFDIALIQGMKDERIHQLVRELARMLSGLGYELVAEGIETREVFDRVIAAGFSHAQGFYLDTPKRHHGKQIPS